MTTVYDIRMKMNENMDLKQVCLKLKEAYDTHSKVRYVLDTRGGAISLENMKRFKTVFDKFESRAKEKLVETVILVDGGFKKMLMKSYIKIFNSDDKIRII